MRHIVHPEKQKFIITAIAAAGVFFGLQVAARAIGYYQIEQFLAITFFTWLFLVTLQTFVFDLHLKNAATWQGMERSFISALRHRFHYLAHRPNFLHFQNYLILPGIIFWTTVAWLFLNPFEIYIKQAVIISSTLALALASWYLKTVFYSHHEAGRQVRQLIFLVKLYASYLAFTAFFGAGRYFGFSDIWFGTAVFATTFLLLYQALFQHHFVGLGALKMLLASGATMAGVGAVIYLLWGVNYYTGALLLAAFYNVIWGFVHHKYIDHNLTREIVYEYLAVLFIILVIVIGSTNFAERI